MEWTPEHQRAVDLFRTGQSMFVTGSAGSGKTVLLRYLISLVAGDKGVHCTAMTGMAAQALPEGTTLHKFAGLGLAQGEAKALVQGMKYPVQTRWRSARILVIDEVSMLDAELFEKFDQVRRSVSGRAVRGGPAPLPLPPNSAPAGSCRTILPPARASFTSWFRFCLAVACAVQLTRAHTRSQIPGGGGGGLAPLAQHCRCLTWLYTSAACRSRAWCAAAVSCGGASSWSCLATSCSFPRWTDPGATACRGASACCSRASCSPRRTWPRSVRPACSRTRSFRGWGCRPPPAASR